MEILELEILSGDLEATEQFYHGLLGLTVIKRDQEKLALAAGATTLVFRKSHGPAPAYHFAFNIPADQLADAQGWLQTRVRPLELENGQSIAEFTSWNARAVYFYDNNGNVVEFIGRFDLPLSSGRPFDASCILSVSEIGLAVDDVMGFTDDLSRDLGILPFAKQARRTDFAAMGDDEGLFIVATDQRPWYPTSQPAQKAFTRVSYLLNGKSFELVWND